MVKHLIRSFIAFACVLLPLSTASAQVASGDYVIRPQDTLEITVWNTTGLRSKYIVEPDGAITFAYIGRIQAAGLTPFQLETELKKKLSPDYILKPQITVKVEEFRTGRVFVWGGVGSPGPVPLTPNMRLLEALARAGYGNASEAVIIRPKSAGAAAAAVGVASIPTDSDENDVINVNLREFEKEVLSGDLSRNVLLRDGDSILVPRVDANRIFITGEVRKPDAYSIPSGTTVLQALALAGGVTENASMNRISIVRMVKGKKQTIKAKPDTVVEFGDTIIVRERFF